ncbi:MAG: hypothetical protein ACR2JY_07795 [Chloroflexota bacterium]
MATGVGAFEAAADAALLLVAADVVTAAVDAAVVPDEVVPAVVALFAALAAVVEAALVVGAALLVAALLVGAALLVAALLPALLPALVVTEVAADPPQAASDSPASASEARIRKLRREDVFNDTLSSCRSSQRIFSHRRDMILQERPPCDGRSPFQPSTGDSLNELPLGNQEQD